jgi:hypothetical protein
VAGLIGLRFDPRFPLAGAVIVATALLAFTTPRTATTFAVGMCVWIFAVLWSYDAFLRPVFAETPSAVFVKPLETVPESVPVLCVGTPYRVQAQVAVLSGGRHMPQPARTVSEGAVYIMPEALFAQLPSHYFRVGAEGSTYRHVDGRLFLESWQGKSRDQLLAERRRTFVLALPAQ